jgi:hypothetical protein
MAFEKSTLLGKIISSISTLLVNIISSIILLAILFVIFGRIWSIISIPLDYIQHDAREASFYEKQKRSVKQEYSKIKTPEKVTQIEEIVLDRLDEHVLNRHRTVGIDTTYAIKTDNTNLQEHRQEIENYYYHELRNNGWNYHGKSDNLAVISFTKFRLVFHIYFLEENQFRTSIRRWR